MRLGLTSVGTGGAVGLIPAYSTEGCHWFHMQPVI